MHYPIGNELFLTTDYSCQLSNLVPVQNVMAVYDISLGTDHARGDATFFVSHCYDRKAASITLCDRSWFQSCLHCSDQTLISLNAPPQISVSNNEPNTLSLVSLFDGFGLLARGLEVGSSDLFSTSFTVDIFHAAYLLSKANLSNPANCDSIHDDLNNVLGRICHGLLPTPDPAIFVAGFECQGYIIMNNVKEKEKSHRSRTLGAHTMS